MSSKERSLQVQEWLCAVQREFHSVSISCHNELFGFFVEQVKSLGQFSQFTVSLQLHIVDELEVLDEASYLSSYGNECTFSTVLSDGRRVELLPGGEGRVVKPEERQEYACFVRQARMTEFTKQV